MDYFQINCFAEACGRGSLKQVINILESRRTKKILELDGANAFVESYNWGFIYACENGSLDIVQYLLSSSIVKDYVDIHAEDNAGFSRAYKHGRLDIVKYLLTSPDLKEHNTFEDYEHLDWWFDNHGAEQMHQWISLMSQERIDNLYEKHEDVFIEKFTLEANLPVHPHNCKENQQQEEIELII